VPREARRADDFQEGSRCPWKSSQTINNDGGDAFRPRATNPKSFGRTFGLQVRVEDGSFRLYCRRPPPNVR
jgi:hypothetical protein